MLFEDAHWVDPTLARAARPDGRARAHLPMLLIVTFRPEFQPPWAGQPHVTLHGAEPPGPARRAALVEHVAGGTALARRDDRGDRRAHRRRAAVRRGTDQGGAGERRTRRQVAAVLSATPHSALSVPATLHASLMARLDRLGRSAKESRRSARRSGASSPTSCSPRSRGGPRRSCAPRWTGWREQVWCSAAALPPNASYMFKHALVQDAAYGTLLRGRRQDLHGRAADALIAAGQAATTEPEIIAHHLQECHAHGGGDRFLAQAGDTRLAVPPNREAAEHFRRALALVEAQPGSPERRRIELAVLSQLASPLMGAYGCSAAPKSATWWNGRRCRPSARKLRRTSAPAVRQTCGFSIPPGPP